MREINITIFLNSLVQVLFELNIASIVIAIKNPRNPPTKTDVKRANNIIYPGNNGESQILLISDWALNESLSNPINLSLKSPFSRDGCIRIN